MFDLKKEFEKILKPIAGDIKYRVSDSVLTGTIVDEQPIEIEIDWLISGDINTPIQGKKKYPIGEKNQGKIIKAVQLIDVDDFVIELKGIGKRFNVDGIKHIFKYKVNLDKKPEKGLTEIIVPKLEEKKPIEKNTFKKVRDYGKNTIDSK